MIKSPTLRALLAAFMLFAGCSPTLLNRRIAIAPTMAPPAGGAVAVISKIDFQPTNGKPVADENLNALRESVRFAVYNSGRFQDVLLGQKPANPTVEVAYYDFTVTPEDNGRINWWAAWPAVYPLVCYWPFQPRSGTAKVHFQVQVTGGPDRGSAFEISATKNYKILMYGFFRMQPIENAVHQCYEECLAELTAKVASMGPASDAPQAIAASAAEPGGSARTARNVAVLDLESDVMSRSECLTLTNKLRSELIRTGLFKVMERNQMESILKEQGFQQTGCTSDACMVEVGQLIGVDQLVAGHLGKVGGVYLVTLRVIDVAHGAILFSADQEVEGDAGELVKSGLKRAAEKLARSAR